MTALLHSWVIFHPNHPQEKSENASIISEQIWKWAPRQQPAFDAHIYAINWRGLEEAILSRSKNPTLVTWTCLTHETNAILSDAFSWGWVSKLLDIKKKNNFDLPTTCWKLEQAFGLVCNRDINSSFSIEPTILLIFFLINNHGLSSFPSYEFLNTISIIVGLKWGLSPLYSKLLTWYGRKVGGCQSNSWPRPVSEAWESGMTSEIHFRITLELWSCELLDSVKSFLLYDASYLHGSS